MDIPREGGDSSDLSFFYDDRGGDRRHLRRPIRSALGGWVGASVPFLREYSLFICHAWDYSDDYERLEQFLDDAPNFAWNNLSVPEHEAIDAQDEELEYELRGQIRPAHAVLIPA